VKVKISKSNPFKYDRYGFAYENIKSNTKCLDYGCYDGNFMFKVTQHKKGYSIYWIR
jgi:hypothetical protein